MAIGDDNPRTPVEKLCALFASRTVQLDYKRGTSHQHLRGGMLNLATAIGCDKTAIAHWNRRYNGVVPLAWRARIVAAADAAGIPRAKLADLLPAEKCPCCGQMVDPGAVHA